jgi:hypothetical protein
LDEVDEGVDAAGTLSALLVFSLFSDDPLLELRGAPDGDL